MANKINILVTQKTFDEHFSIDDWFNFGKLTQKELYEHMLNFVVDDNGEPVTTEVARGLFKGVPKSEWTAYITAFMGSVRDAFVNPTSGGS
jgi:hypothetical protein